MKTREEIIIKLVKNKKVLDLGNSWGDFKDLIKSQASSYKGLDIEKGTDYCYDLNKPFKLKEKFDVIVSGELIEHIENIGIFLDNIKNVMHKNSYFVLTTPNPTSFRFIFYGLFGKEPAFGGHIKYFTPDSLKLLLNRYFKIVKIGFCNNTTNIKGKDSIVWKIKYNTENIIGNIVKRYSPHIYAICKRK